MSDRSELLEQQATIPRGDGRSPDASARDRERHRALQHEVAGIFAESASVTEASTRVLEAVCDRLGWQFGAFWRVDPQANRVRCIDVSCRKEGLVPFIEASRRAAFPPGVGLPGRVWAADRPAWVPDVTRDDNFPRAPFALQVGLHGAFGFPIRSRNRITGVMEFFSQAIEEPDEELLGLMATIGSQVGQLMARREAEEAVRASEARKAAISAELEATNETLRAREEQLRLITDAAPALISYVDVHSCYRLNNRAYETWFGRSPESIRGKHMREVLGEAAWERLRPHVEAALSGKQVAFEEPMPYKEGGTRWVSVTYTPHRGRDGAVEGFVVLVFDVTERKRAEADFRYLMEHARCLIWHAYVEARQPPATGYHWDVQVFDEEAAQRFLPLEIPPGQTYPIAFFLNKPPEDRVMVDRNAAAAFEAGRDYYRQEYRCRRRDGQDRWLLEETHIEPLGHARWRTVGVCTDITERRRAEAALRQQAEELREMDRQKDQFLAVLGHELRNPVGIMTNAMHLLRRRSGENPRALDSCDVLERQLRQIARIVGDLQDASRIKLGRLDLNPQAVDLVGLVRQVVDAARPAAEERQQWLSLELPAEPMMVAGDPERLHQVFMNLLHNAIKYTEPGGVIRMTAARDGASGAVRVADSGVGIAVEALPEVFEMFTQSDRSGVQAKGGLGIGLGLVRALVEMHGGKVTAASEGEGQGSEFVVHLPLAAAGPPNREA